MITPARTAATTAALRRTVHLLVFGGVSSASLGSIVCHQRVQSMECPDTTKRTASGAICIERYLNVADAAVWAFASERGYLGSMSPTIAAIIASPIRKSWISVGAPIDCLPHPFVISGLG